MIMCFRELVKFRYHVWVCDPCMGPLNGLKLVYESKGFKFKRNIIMDLTHKDLHIVNAPH